MYMLFQQFLGIPRGKLSPYRKNLFIATIEGIPATFAFSLLNAPFLTGYLLLLGANSFEIGLVLALPTLLNLIQIPAAYWLQQTENRRRWFILSATLHRIFWTLTGAVPFLIGENYYFGLYFLFYLLAFSSNAIGSMIWTSLIADMVPKQVRGQYFGFRNMLNMAVNSAGLFLGGYLLQQIPGLDGYHILFVIAGIAAALNIGTLFLYPNMPFERSESVSIAKMVKKPLENKLFTRSMTFISLWQFLQTLVVPLFSYIMLSVMGLGEFLVSMLTIVQTIAMMISFYIWGRLNTRMSARYLLMFTFPIIAAACLLWSATLILPTVLVLVLIHILLGIGLGGNQMLVFNFLIGDFPSADRPMYIAVFSAITGVAAFLGPTVGGYIFDLIREKPQWIQVMGVTTTVGVILLLLALIRGPVIFSDRKRTTKA
jgi:MFS family permease